MTVYTRAFDHQRGEVSALWSVAFINHCQIAAPQAVCFAYSTNLEHDRDWWSPVTASQRASGDGGVGTMYQQTASVGMLKVSSHIEITAYDPHRSMDFMIDSHGHMRCQVRYTFTQQNSLTTFPMQSQITFLPLWMKLATPSSKRS